MSLFLFLLTNSLRIWERGRRKVPGACNMACHPQVRIFIWR